MLMKSCLRTSYSTVQCLSMEMIQIVCKINLVDPWMFQRMRKVANNQVKIQLALLEELLLMLSKGRQELADIIEQGLVLEENAIHERISYLHQAAAEFEDALVLHRFHIKYPLYSVSSCTVIPEMEMALSIKTPVIFEGNKCFATSDSIVLHWNVADQHKPGEQFEIHYKLIHPNNEAESKQMWKLTCPSYCLQINGLMPDRFYECAVKRVDTSFLVYGLWNDAIVLRTVLGTVENSEANRV
ncbi:fibronectin type III domain-containing protein 11-like isoform X3 [Hoplias malabaricus]|uniref:fibronectin type III domain-containing protein 11-like isoform X3 n=1 Tax=Hoplias malabaricus TaxID=27720 RepID=UPI0034621F05